MSIIKLFIENVKRRYDEWNQKPDQDYIKECSDYIVKCISNRSVIN